MRIASFGFRSIPPSKGSAGADKFAVEFLPRLAERGHEVTGYNRIYPGQEKGTENYKGVKVKYFKTIPKSGIDSIIHSSKVTWHIITRNSADIVHIQGNNAIFALILKIFGKKVILSIDGTEWGRDKWSWFMQKLVLANAYLAVWSSKYIAKGSADFSPILNAGVGVVGPINKSTFWNAASKSLRIRRRTFRAFR